VSELPSFHCAGTIEIPDTGHQHGLMHALVRDRNGSCYLTDEVNHSLMSIDSKGMLAWHRGGCGKNPGFFYYPTGLDLGWVSINGEKTRCVAVCDSWNNRIQFFSLDGTYLREWLGVYDIAFRNVIDVRFVDSENTDGNMAYWLILDRDNNRLCAMDVDAKPLWQIGQMFPPNLQGRWMESMLERMRNLTEQETNNPISAYDPVFYPLGILGSQEKALYVREADPRRLKLLSHGCLLPVRLTPPHSGEWISADSEGFLAWSRSAGILSYFDLYSKCWYESAIQGIPIPSGRRAREIWMQNGNILESWIWNRGDVRECALNIGNRIPLAGLAAVEMEILTGDDPHGIVRKLLDVADSLNLLGHKVLELCRDRKQPEDLLLALRDEINSNIERLQHVSGQLDILASDFSSLILKVMHLQLHPSDAKLGESSRELTQALASLPAILNIKMAELLRCRDEVKMSHSREAESPVDEVREGESCGAIITEMQKGLTGAMEEAACWHGRVLLAINSLSIHSG
jgi:hypothetical protein